jgi:long-chain acyl-CoA synthetase
VPGSPFPTAEEIVTSRARREPMRPALEWHRRGLLLGRLADLTVAKADALGASVPPGAVVAQVMTDTPGLVVATLAIWRAGCVAAPLDARLAPADLGAHLAHARVDAVVVHEEHVERVEEALRLAACEAPLLVSRGPNLLPAGRPGRFCAVPRRALSDRRRPASSDVAFLAYQPHSGEPRAVVLSHANVVASSLRVSGGRGDGPDDVALATHPLHDVAGFVAEILSRLVSGGSAAILGRTDADAVLESVENHRVTDLSLSSDLVAQLLERARVPRRAVRSVRKILLRNVRLPMTAKRELASRFPGAELVQSYGLAETTDGILMAGHDVLFRKPDTLGKPHPGLVVGVADEAGRLLRPGLTGEIVCRGAVVMRGYHRAPRLTAGVLRDGWLHTGDLGYIDEDGEIQLAGRVAPRGPASRKPSVRK